MLWTEATTERTMKILEKIVEGLIRQVVSIDDCQFIEQGRCSRLRQLPKRPGRS